jgi:large subunit ribosomal protein L23
MGLFTKDEKETKSKKTSVKKATKKAEAPAKKETLKGSKEVTSLDLTKILKNPRITEKAAHMSEGNVYTFDVTVRSTKPEIKKAIKALYGVDARKINISAIPKKAVYRKGGKGMKGGGKKAYVFLEKGQTIEFV